jgi:hypothetical protein
MAWVYLDDNFTSHPKVIAAMAIDPLAPWLFVAGMCYCRKYLNGGLMHNLAVPTLMPLYKPRMRSALITVVLWEDSGDWTQVHDYEDWNQTEDDQREARSEKASKAATARWERTRLAQLNGASR